MLEDGRSAGDNPFSLRVKVGYALHRLSVYGRGTWRETQIHPYTPKNAIEKNGSCHT